MLQNTVRLIELLPGDGGRKLVVKLIHRIPGEECSWALSHFAPKYQVWGIVDIYPARTNILVLTRTALSRILESLLNLSYFFSYQHGSACVYLIRTKTIFKR